MTDNENSSATGTLAFERAAVVGAGVMGLGIAQTFAVAGLQTTCIDLDEKALEKAWNRIVDGRYGLARAHARGYLRQPVDEVLSRLRFTTDLASGVAGCDLALEAVPEDLALKVRLFRQLDALADPGCLFVSNTSGLAISAMAYATNRPALVLGWHWASPPVRMPFAEIVKHRDSDQDALRRVTELATACGKRPIVVMDQPLSWGFVANRIYFATLQ